MFSWSTTQNYKIVPSFFEEEEGKNLGKHVTLKEVDEALNPFKNEKSRGPDGWIVDLFLHFFHIMGEDFLAMVDFSIT